LQFFIKSVFDDVVLRQASVSLKVLLLVEQKKISFETKSTNAGLRAIPMGGGTGAWAIIFNCSNGTWNYHMTVHGILLWHPAMMAWAVI
jgi:hypothetical protein